MPLDNSLGGAGATPGSYTVVAQSPTILVQGANSVVDAMTITILVSTVQVQASFTVPRTVWQAAAGTVAAGAGGAGVTTGVGELASEYAALIEALALLAPVVGIAYAQDVNVAGFLIDTLNVTIATPDGTQSAIVNVPFNPAQETAANNAILAAYQNLLAVAALT